MTCHGGVMMRWSGARRPRSRARRAFSARIAPTQWNAFVVHRHDEMERREKRPKYRTFRGDGTNRVVVRHRRASTPMTRRVAPRRSFWSRRSFSGIDR